MLQDDENVIIEKDYLLEGSADNAEDVWQKGLDTVVEEAWDVKAVHAEDRQITVDKRVKVAVLDSGLDKFAKLSVAGCMNFVDPDTDDIGMDTTGHGTAVQNIILSNEESTATESVAKENQGISMYSLKVLDEENQAPISRVTAAIHWCIENDIDIINMSFGTLVPSEILEQAIKEAADAGILMIAAVGNGGEASGSTVEYPAAFSEVVGVGSVNQNMEVSDFSSKGEEVELVAPGENVPVSIPWGYYGVNSGTSFAAPHVTAVAGLLWAQDKGKSAEDIRSLLRASAKGGWEEYQAGNGMVDYSYASKIQQSYERVDEEKVSDTNKNKLVEYGVPEVVQARWCSNGIGGLETNLKYKHHDLVDACQKSGSLKKDELDILYYTISYADNQKNKVYNNKTLSDCKALHAGRYYDSHNDVQNYINYVSASRCLYNCAYLLWNQGYTKAQLKAYTDKHYHSSEQTAGAIEKTKQDLRIIINVAHDNDFLGKKGTLATRRVQALQFLGFALHAATDAYAHQYVINPNDAKGIMNNTQITRYQGSLTENKKPVKTNIQFDPMLGSLLETGRSSIKSLDLNAYDGYEKEAHKYYADNISFVYPHYDTGAKDCVAQMMSLFGGTTLNKFDPRVFINNSYNGATVSNARIPLWNLYTNVTDAGYTPSAWAKSSITACSMTEAWKRLSFWK